MGKEDGDPNFTVGSYVSAQTAVLLFLLILVVIIIISFFLLLRNQHISICLVFVLTCTYLAKIVITKRKKSEGLFMFDLCWQALN